MTPEELRSELARRLPGRPVREIDEFAILILEIVGGKYLTGVQRATALRNAKIRVVFDGSNLNELADQFGLSTRQIRRVLHK